MLRDLTRAQDETNHRSQADSGHQHNYWAATIVLVSREEMFPHYWLQHASQ